MQSMLHRFCWFDTELCHGKAGSFACCLQASLFSYWSALLADTDLHSMRKEAWHAYRLPPLHLGQESQREGLVSSPANEWDQIVLATCELELCCHLGCVSNDQGRPLLAPHSSCCWSGYLFSKKISITALLDWCFQTLRLLCHSLRANLWDRHCIWESQVLRLFR